MWDQETTDENPFASPAADLQNADPISRVQKLYKRQLFLLWFVLGFVVAFIAGALFVVLTNGADLGALAVILTGGVITVVVLGICLNIVANRVRNTV